MDFSASRTTYCPHVRAQNSESASRLVEVQAPGRRARAQGPGQEEAGQPRDRAGGREPRDRAVRDWSGQWALEGDVALMIQ